MDGQMFRPHRGLKVKKNYIKKKIQQRFLEVKSGLGPAMCRLGGDREWNVQSGITKRSFKVPHGASSVRVSCGHPRPCLLCAVCSYNIAGLVANGATQSVTETPDGFVSLGSVKRADPPAPPITVLDPNNAVACDARRLPCFAPAPLAKC